MSRFFLLFVVAALALTLAGSPVAAQNITDANNQTAEIDQRIDEEVAVLEWDYNDRLERFEIELVHEGDRPKTVTMVESVQREEGSGAISFEDQRILPGEDSITVEVKPRAGEAGVVLYTSDSLQQDRAVFLSTGVHSPGPWSQTTASSGWFGGITVMAGMTVAAALKRMRETHDAPEELE